MALGCQDPKFMYSCFALKKNQKILLVSAPFLHNVNCFYEINYDHVDLLEFLDQTQC